MSARCYYCAKPVSGRQEPEHVLPAALGAELVTSKVHTDCNRRAGREVDQPWLADPEVVQARQRHAVLDRRGKLRRLPAVKGQLIDDGAEALVHIDGDVVDIRRTPRLRTNGAEVIAEGYTDDELARWRQRNPAYTWVRTDSVIEPSLSARVTLTLGVNVWPRFAAKVALGIASLVVDDDGWLDTPSARTLRNVLWKGHFESSERALAHPGVAWSAIPWRLEPGSHPYQAPEHLVTFVSTEADGQWLVVVMFGELLYRVPLAMEWGTMPAQSWLFSPKVPKGQQLPAAIQWLCLLQRNRMGTDPR